MRAISVLWMIGFHALYVSGYFLSAQQYQRLSEDGLLAPLAQGQLGVDIFFVLSGYLISRLLLAERDRSGGIHPGRFYLRRAFRIFPAYWVTLLLGRLILKGHIRFEHAWANLLLVHNFLPLAEQSLAWAWSLAVEEQFYLLLPLLLLWSRSSGAEPRLRARKSLPWLAALLALAFAIRGALVFGLGVRYPTPFHAALGGAEYGRYFDSVYDKTYCRYGSIVAGVLVTYLERAESPLVWLNRHRCFARGLLAACCLGLLAYASPPGHRLLLARGSALASGLVTTAYGYVFSALCAYLLLYCLARAHAGAASRLRGALSWRRWRPIAELSYGAYLLHPLVLVALWNTWADWKDPQPADPVPAAVVLAVAALAELLTFFFAYLSYRLLERPLRRFSHRLVGAGDG